MKTLSRWGKQYKTDQYTIGFFQLPDIKWSNVTRVFLCLVISEKQGEEGLTSIYFGVMLFLQEPLSGSGTGLVTMVNRIMDPWLHLGRFSLLVFHK